jgi:hypothetical protein
VGLIQKAVEKTGIGTISITHLPDLSKKVSVPRALHLRFPLGRSFGAAGRKDLQRKIVVDMLEGISSINEEEPIVTLPYRWKKD